MSPHLCITCVAARVHRAAARRRSQKLPVVIDKFRHRLSSQKVRSFACATPLRALRSISNRLVAHSASLNRSRQACRIFRWPQIMGRQSSHSSYQLDSDRGEKIPGPSALEQATVAMHDRLLFAARQIAAPAANAKGGANAGGIE